MARAHEELRLGLPFRGGIQGAVRHLGRIMQSTLCSRASRVVVCFDGKPPAYRRELLPSYKADRGDKHARLGFFPDYKTKRRAMRQLRHTRKLLTALGAVCVRYADFEADDVVMAAVQVCVEDGEQPLVLTSDSDLYQTVHAGARVFNLGTSVVIDAGNFARHASTAPDCYLLLRALVGGKDGIKGARGVAEKRASEMLCEAHWDVRLCTGALAQLDSLCQYLARKPKKSKREAALIADRARLERTIEAIDLAATPVDRYDLRRKMAAVPAPSVATFVREARALGLRGLFADAHALSRAIGRATSARK